MPSNLSEIFSLFSSVEALREKAASGDVAAQYRMGRMYESGRRVAQSDEMAAQWYHRAADGGHAEAQYRLGLMYASGRGVSRDSRKAIRRLRLAAEQGVAGARPLLEQVEIEAAAEAEAGWRGRRASQPAPDATAETGRAGRKAAPQAPTLPFSPAKIVFAIIAIVFLINVGMAFFAIDRFNRATRQSPPPQPAPTARPGPSVMAAHYLAQAEKGDLKAIFRVARMYDRGSDGMPQDDELAVAWYRKGAARGHALSEHCLGWMHEHGRGVPKDEEEALKWYRRAAAKGEQASVSRLQELENRRLEREQRRVDQGDAEALYRRGLRFELGKGGPEDDEQAALWYLRAAQQGHPVAQFKMGVFHDAGRGRLAQNHELAARWHLRAAEQGLADAQVALGWKYEKGQGAPQDEEQALAWYRKAAASGSELGRMRLEALEKGRAGR